MMTELLTVWQPPPEGTLSLHCFPLNQTCGPLSMWPTAGYLQGWGPGPS